MTRRGRPTTTRPFEHACRVYAAMAERSMPLAEAPAEVRALADPSTTGPDSRVFIGALVALFESVGLPSRAQYHVVRSNLVAIGSIVRLRRGTGRVQSVWLLGPAPSITTWGRAIGQPEQQRLLAKVEAEHHLRLAVLLKDLPTIAPTLAEEMRLAGVRTVGQAIDYLKTLPTVRLAGLGPGCCLRFVGRVEHTCGAESVLPEPVQPHSPRAWSGSGCTAGLGCADRFGVQSLGGERVPPELLPLDWLLDWMSAERVVALATMGQLVVLVVAALYARAQVREARELREDQARPFVVVDFEPWERPWINLVVTNVGRTMARNVRIEVDPPFESTLDRAVEVSMAQLKLFTEPIPSLAPGKRIEFLFDSLIDRRTAGLPTAYRVRLRYEGERGPLPPDEQYLDLDLYRFRIRVDRDSIHDVSVTLKKIERQFDKWTASFEGGLLVLSPEDQRRRNEDLRNWPDE